MKRYCKPENIAFGFVLASYVAVMVGIFTQWDALGITGFIGMFAGGAVVWWCSWQNITRLDRKTRLEQSPKPLRELVDDPDMTDQVFRWTVLHQWVIRHDSTSSVILPDLEDSNGITG